MFFPKLDKANQNIDAGNILSLKRDKYRENKIQAYHSSNQGKAADKEKILAVSSGKQMPYIRGCL